MRLIDAEKLRIQEFTGDPPPYAILSHRWGDDAEEVAYHEFHLPGVKSRPGYAKIENSCTQAKSDGLRYVWVDTCCIDKRSSAELSEAINSMFNWYRDAVICYAFLEDVFSPRDTRYTKSDFENSAWFTRGWTLQELLAPSIVVFFRADWKPIGTRSVLKSTIARITKISPEFFVDGNLGKFSVAQKMSWASQRHTKRTEDEAYCLLGIFGVNMPLLYGEGTRAFTRLQEEIMKISDDQTLFAWYPAKPSNTLDYNLSYTASAKLDGGLLSPSATHFAHSGHIVRASPLLSSLSAPYTMTNKGLQITLALVMAPMSTVLSNDTKSEGSAHLQSLHDSGVDDGRRLPADPSSPPHPTIVSARAAMQYGGITTSVQRELSQGLRSMLYESGAKRVYALLDCHFEHTPGTRLAVIIESANFEVWLQRENSLPSIRAAHQQGLVSINVTMPIVQHLIKPHNLLIKANEDISRGLRLWASRRDDKLVLIEPLPRSVAGFELHETVPNIQWKQQADMGDISLHLSSANFSYGRVGLLFRHKSGDYAFLIIIKSANQLNGDRQYDVHCRTNLNRKEQTTWRSRFYDKSALGVGGYFQEGPNHTHIKLTLNVRQAQHALLLKLEDKSEGANPFERQAQIRQDVMSK